MEQDQNEKQNQILLELLRNPSSAGYKTAAYLEQLVNQEPQSGLLQAMYACSANRDKLRSAAVYFNSSALYKMAVAPATLAEVKPEQLINFAPPVSQAQEPAIAEAAEQPAAITEVPVVEQLAAPHTEEETLIAEKDIPVTEEETPVAEEGVPVIEEQTLVAEEHVPVIKEETPAAEEEIPVAEEETRVADPVYEEIAGFEDAGLTPVNEPLSSEELQVVAAADNAATEPVAAMPQAEPTAVETTAEPVTAEPETETALTEVAAEPVTAEIAPEPAITEAATEPVAEEPEPEPAITGAKAEPLTVETITAGPEVAPALTEVPAEAPVTENETPSVAPQPAEPQVTEAETQQAASQPAAAEAESAGTEPEIKPAAYLVPLPVEDMEYVPVSEDAVVREADIFGETLLPFELDRAEPDAGPVTEGGEVVEDADLEEINKAYTAVGVPRPPEADRTDRVEERPLPSAQPTAGAAESELEFQEQPAEPEPAAQPAVEHATVAQETVPAAAEERTETTLPQTIEAAQEENTVAETTAVPQTEAPVAAEVHQAGEPAAVGAEPETAAPQEAESDNDTTAQEEIPEFVGAAAAELMAELVAAADEPAATPAAPESESLTEEIEETETTQQPAGPETEEEAQPEAVEEPVIALAEAADEPGVAEDQKEEIADAVAQPVSVAPVAGAEEAQPVTAELPADEAEITTAEAPESEEAVAVEESVQEVEAAETGEEQITETPAFAEEAVDVNKLTPGEAETVTAPAATEGLVSSEASAETEAAAAPETLTPPVAAETPVPQEEPEAVGTALPEEAASGEVPVADDATSRLILENLAISDYFSFDRAFQEKSSKQAEQQPEENVFGYEIPFGEGMAEQGILTEEASHVTRYSDDKMPYSFMWWLDKTRREQPGTHQPYARAAAQPAESTTADAQPISSEIPAPEIGSYAPVPAKVPEFNIGQTAEPGFREKEEKLIDRFIKEEPHLKPQAGDKPAAENKARKSAEDQGELITETLARIYTDQGLYTKAIYTYEKLMLKYPQKSSYFASIINELQQNIS